MNTTDDTQQDAANFEMDLVKCAESTGPQHVSLWLACLAISVRALTGDPQQATQILMTSGLPSHTCQHAVAILLRFLQRSGRTTVRSSTDAQLLERFLADDPAAMSEPQFVAVCARLNRANLFQSAENAKRG